MPEQINIVLCAAKTRKPCKEVMKELKKYKRGSLIPESDPWQ